jgi:hypothetical protein
MAAEARDGVASRTIGLAVSGCQSADRAASLVDMTYDQRRTVAGLVRRVQALSAERRRLLARHAPPQELADNERALEQLRWRLAYAARRAASGDGPLAAA